MSFKNAVIVSVALMISLPALLARAEENSSHRKPNRGPASISSVLPSSVQRSDHKELTRIYQSLIRDSQKQLSPTVGEHNVYLPAPLSAPADRALASDRNRLPVHFDARYSSAAARHAAIPWAADTSMGGAVFSVK